MEAADNILRYAHHVARHCPPGATEHGLNRRVLKMLYDFLTNALDRDEALSKKDHQPPFECWGALRSWTPQQPASPLNTHVLHALLQATSNIHGLTNCTP